MEPFDICTVLLNPVIDIHYFMDRFEIGRDNLISCRKIFAAGKGMNVSRALHAFGVPCSLFLLLGRENADQYLALSKEYGVPLSYVLTEGAVRENLSVNTPQSETRICRKDYAASPQELTKLAQMLRGKITANSIVVFSGSLPNGISQEMFAGFAASIRQAASNVNIVLDCPDLTLATVKQLSPLFIKPNFNEAMQMLGSGASSDAGADFDPAQAEAAAKRLREAASCQTAVISCGRAGAAFAAGGGQVSGFLKAPPLSGVASTVGAGDSMVAGILYGMLQQARSSAADVFNMPEALLWGVAFGSAACLTEGTCPPGKQEVLQILKTI